MTLIPATKARGETQKIHFITTR